MKIKNVVSYPISIENTTDNDVVINFLPTEAEMKESGIPNYEGVIINTNVDTTPYESLIWQKNLKPLRVNRVLISSNNAVYLISKLKITHVEEHEGERSLTTNRPIVFIIPPRQFGNISVVENMSFVLNERSYLRITAPARKTFILYLIAQ